MKLARLALLLALCNPILAASPAGGGETMEISPAQLVDLTHPFDAKTIYWPTEKGFSLEGEFAGMTDKGYYYAANRFCTAEHGGTHVDAPIHFAAGKLTVDQIPLENLVGSGLIVDVSKKAAGKPDYQVEIGDFEEWEKRNGNIPHGSLVLIRTGFGKFWPDRKKYLGTAETGEQAVAKLRFPGLHPEAAQWLAEKRQIRAVGIDTASIDYGRSTLFETHRRLFEKNIPAFENVANLESLPEKGFTLIALPMKIAGGSGSPLRIIAILPHP